MGEVQWIKIYIDMFDKRKIKKVRRLPAGNDLLLIWIMLLAMAGKCNAGGITELKRQVEFELIPTQREPDAVGVRGGIKKGKVIEQKCSYIADFVYYEDGKKVVEDTKGFKTKDYVIKRKLMLWVHGIRIREI